MVRIRFPPAQSRYPIRFMRPVFHKFDSALYCHQELRKRRGPTPLCKSRRPVENPGSPPRSRPSVSDDASCADCVGNGSDWSGSHPADCGETGSSVKPIGRVAPGDDGFGHLLQFLSCHPGLCDRQFPEDAAHCHRRCCMIASPACRPGSGALGSRCTVRYVANCALAISASDSDRRETPD